MKKLNYLVRKLYYSLDPSSRLLIRKIIFFPIDFLDYIRGSRHPFQPPKGLIFTGRGNFIKTGKHFADLLKKHAGLTADSYILDVGCGIGRLAVSLTDVLGTRGKYEGFDIVESGINWCKKNISTKFSNFNFMHIPAFNTLYNTKINIRSSHLKFPYPDCYFDIAVATSVFTHMLYDDMIHYIEEIQRTLKPGGRAMITFFIIDENSKKHMNNSEINFRFTRGNYFIMDEKVPEANVAYSEELINEIFRQRHFDILLRIPGSWSTAPIYRNSPEFQDTLFIKKLH
ncbi:class I SAM-dependent methyltransferase [Schleiferia thermophila]|uniref:Methyltransferase family protein n=1 Tax=Schleiferia thermophila TaxID=884107 RepID=A0A368ZXS7_9FLAO|nr:class I SAM-dependent methyltransferase [Schleiferia thermophila]RCX01078.1 methyltransferase family protein [Schleiferia thermophila]